MSSTTVLSEASLSKGRALARIKPLILIGSGTVLLALSAKISIPFYPVPMTLQTLAVLLLAATFGFRMGLATVVLYLIEGALGLPVFAGTPARGIGIPYLLGPTGGYLMGFLLAVAFVGYASDKGWTRKISRIGLIMMSAHLFIYIPGLLWLAQFTGTGRVLELGLFPFLPGDLLKLALAVCLYGSGKKFIEKIS